MILRPAQKLEPDTRPEPIEEHETGRGYEPEGIEALETEEAAVPVLCDQEGSQKADDGRGREDDKTPAENGDG